MARTSFSATLPRIKPEDGGNGAPRAAAQSISLKDIAREAALGAEREAMAKVLAETRWNRVKAAKLLKISYRALLYKIKQVGLEPEPISLQPKL